MKAAGIASFVITALLLVGCSEETPFSSVNVENKTNTVSVLGLEKVKNDSIPAYVYSMSIEEYEQILNEKVQSRSSSDELPLTLGVLDSMIDVVLSPYPNMKDINEEDFNNIQADFPNLDAQEILKHIDAIDSIYNLEIRYTFFNDVLEYIENDASSVNSRSRYPGGLNKEEFKLILRNPRFAKGTKKASEEAKDLTIQYMGHDGWMDKSDAFRHALWNALIVKHIGEKCNTKAAATSWAKKFTDAHEEGGSSAHALDNPMDYKNNSVGRTYIDRHSWIHSWTNGFWIFKRRHFAVHTHDSHTIAKDIKKMADSAVKVNSQTEINNAGYKLVYIK